MGKYLTSLYKFEPATITRGREYFKEGRVHFLQVTPTRVNACVEGSEEYHVHAQFANDGELLSSSCDCPCQFPCKHVVALLFALDDRTPSLATLSSGAASVEEFNEAFQKALAEKDGNAFALAASRLSLSFGPFPKADQERLLRQFLDHLGDFGELGLREGEALSKKLLLILAETGEEKATFLCAYFADPGVNLLAKRFLFAFLYDDSNLTAILEKAFFRQVHSDKKLADSLISSAVLFAPSCLYLSNVLLAYLLDNATLSFQPYELERRLPSLEGKFDPEEGRLYTLIIRFLVAVDYPIRIPERTIAVLKDNDMRDLAVALAYLNFKQSQGFSDYLLYRSFLSDEEVKEQAAALLSLVRQKSYYETFLFHESALGCFPAPSYAKLSLTEIAAFKGTPSPELIQAAEKRFEAVLKLQRSDEELIPGLYFLYRAHSAQLETWVKDPRLLAKAERCYPLQSALLFLAWKMGSLEAMGFRVYGGQHVPQ